MQFHPRNLLVVSVAVLLSFLAGSAGAADRGFVTGNFFLTLEGVTAGFLKSVEGGSVTAEVVEEKPAPGGFAKKHIGNPKYEDITLQLGFSNAKSVYDWIAASWQMSYQRKNGSIVAADFKQRPRTERQFFEALITETTIPACDASDMDPGFLTVKLAPELTRMVKPGGSLPPPPPPTRAWRPANFRLAIDGLDTSRVSKIDSFTIKQQIVEDSVGGDRIPGKVPGKLEFPNLKITFAESSAQSWLDWLEDFVVKGNAGDDKERNGTLELLSPNQGTVLARIRFFNLGIVSVGPAKAVRNPCNNGCPADPDDVRDAIGKMQAELYVERMEFEAAGVPQQ
jgi:phage tail-like protein